MTVREYLRKALSAQPATDVADHFRVPSRICGPPTDTHPEYGEAYYESHCELIAREVRKHDPAVQPKAVATMVLEYLLEPGRFRLVARYCGSWDEIEVDEGLVELDAWTLHVGMVTDVLRMIDRKVVPLRVREAQRIIDRARPVGDPHRHEPENVEVALPCHPREGHSIKARTPEAEISCRECGHLWIVQAGQPALAV